MKIRMQGNSIRLRLTQTEVSEVGEGKKVVESVNFGLENAVFHYSIQCWEVEEIEAKFSNNEILIFLPIKLAKTWARTDQVGIGRKIPVDTDQLLQVLIEKDFQCLHKRPAEDESDNFPNPAATAEG